MTPTSVSLSDLLWTSATNGWGPPEKDRSNGELGANDGGTIRLNGTTYAKGLGVHATSEITYTLGGTCTDFTSRVGIDDEIASGGTVVFQVFLDGSKVYDSGTMNSATATKTVNLSNLAGKQELRLVVTDAGDGNGQDHADWADPRIVCSTQTATPTPTPSGTPVSDLTWTLATNGWGPVEKDQSNGELDANDGGAIRLNGISYAKGLGAHAGSDVRYALGGSCTSFTAWVGVDDEIANGGSVVFQVFLDGVKVYDSGVMTSASTTSSVNLTNLAGKQELALVVDDAGDGNGQDHADWAEARLTCS